MHHEVARQSFTADGVPSEQLKAREDLRDYGKRAHPFVTYSQ